jgi:hypothetical protein
MVQKFGFLRDEHCFLIWLMLKGVLDVSGGCYVGVWSPDLGLLGSIKGWVEVSHDSTLTCPSFLGILLAGPDSLGFSVGSYWTVVSSVSLPMIVPYTVMIAGSALCVVECSTSVSLLGLPPTWGGLLDWLTLWWESFRRCLCKSKFLCLTDFLLLHVADSILGPTSNGEITFAICRAPYGWKVLV